MYLLHTGSSTTREMEKSVKCEYRGCAKVVIPAKRDVFACKKVHFFSDEDEKNGTKRDESLAALLSLGSGAVALNDERRLQDMAKR